MQRLTAEQGIIISAYTGFLCCDFSDMHAAIEKKLGRPVFTHELGGHAMADQIKEAFKDDFLSICAGQPDSSFQP
jgi:hypothetical protein